MRLQDKRSPAFTDQDLMPFGKHKGKPLIEVPASYLKWLYGEMRLVWESFSKNFVPGVTSVWPNDYSLERHSIYNYIWNSQNALHLEIKEEKRDDNKRLERKIMFELEEDER